MQATHFATLADQVRKLPAEGIGRDRRLHRLIDLYAFGEAAAALQNAAAHATSRVVANVLTSARAVMGGSLEERDLLRDNTEARDRFRDALMSPEFLSLLPAWVRELRDIASTRPDTGACTIASAFELWMWTMNHFRVGEGAKAESASQVLDELAEALPPVLAARCLAVEVAAQASSMPEAQVELRSDLSHVQAARAAALMAAACAELVYGYRRHLRWDAEGCASCYVGDDVDDLEAIMPGIASGARSSGDVVEADGSHPKKAGPCARFDGVDTFMNLRNRMDGCLTGSRFSRDRAAAAIARSVAAMVPSEGNA